MAMKYIKVASLLASRIKRGVAAIVLCGLLLLASNHTALGQQWTQANGIGNTSIGCLATTGDTLIAGCGSGKKDSIFLSTDNGNNWVMVSDNVPTIITTLAADGTNLLVGSDKPGGSFYSDNFGNAWTRNDSDFPLPSISNYSIASLVVIGDTIFAATGEGVYLQTAPGAPWTPDTVGMEYSGGEVPGANALDVSGTNWFVATQSAGAYCSTNEGASWFQINNGLPSSYYFGTTVEAFATSDATLLQSYRIAISSRPKFITRKTMVKAGAKLILPLRIGEIFMAFWRAAVICLSLATAAFMFHRIKAPIGFKPIKGFRRRMGLGVILWL